MRALLVIAALVIPWLNPFTVGPNSASLQTFATVFCATCLVVYAGQNRRFTGPAFTGLVAGAWGIAALVSAVIGLLQYSGHSDAFSPWISLTSGGEAYGNLRQRNQFATLLNIGLASLLWWQSEGWLRHGRATVPPRGRPALQTLACLFVALLAFATVASASRTGLLQWLLICAASVWWQRRSHASDGAEPTLLRPWQLALWALACYGIASRLLPLMGSGVAHPEIWDRLRSGEGTCSSRIILWSNVLELIAEKPWFGWGAGELAYAHFSHLYAGPRFCEILDNAHNLPLHIAVTLGVPVAVLFCAAVVAAGVRWRPWRERDADRQLAWSVLALIGLHSLLEYPLWYAPFQMAVALAILVASGAAFRARWLGAGVTHLIAGVGFVACAYVAWDYLRVSQIYLPHDQRLSAYQEDTLEKIQGSWLYRSTVQFATLTVTPLTPETAAPLLELAKAMLHFSPEPMVLDKVLEAARLVGRDEDIAYFAPRYQRAYPTYYAQWLARQSDSGLR